LFWPGVRRSISAATPATVSTMNSEASLAATRLMISLVEPM
jgi:hypothetical protein